MVNNQETRTALESLYREKKPQQYFLAVWFAARRQQVVDFFTVPGRIELLLVSLVIALSLSVILIGNSQLRYYTSRDFLTRSVGTSGPSLSLVDNQAAVLPEDLLGLRQRDTDGDGLSDYDELYIYGTSPYLADTDGDGISDYEEIKQGTDPNCPKWRNCTYIPPNYPSYSSDRLYQNVLVDADNDYSAVSFYEPSPELRQEGSNLARQQVEQLTPNQLRDILSMAGLSKEILANFSDQELAQMASEIIATSSQ